MFVLHCQINMQRTSRIGAHLRKLLKIQRTRTALCSDLQIPFLQFLFSESKKCRCQYDLLKEISLFTEILNVSLQRILHITENKKMERIFMIFTPQSMPIKHLSEAFFENASLKTLLGY